MYSGASPCNQVHVNGLQKSELRCRPLAIFLSFCCNVEKLSRLSGDSQFALFYLLSSQTGLVQRPDLQPETKTTSFSFSLATLNGSNSCHRHTKQTRRQGLRTENLFVHHRTRGEGGKPKENRAKKKKEKKRFSYHKPRLCRTQLYLQWCATARKRNRGYGQKDVLLSHLLVSAWCRFQGGEANSSRSVREQKVDKTGNISFPLFYLFAPFSSSLCLSFPLSEVAKTLPIGRKDKECSGLSPCDKMKKAPGLARRHSALVTKRCVFTTHFLCENMW